MPVRPFIVKSYRVFHINQLDRVVRCDLALRTDQQNVAFDDRRVNHV